MYSLSRQPPVHQNVIWCIYGVVTVVYDVFRSHHGVLTHHQWFSGVCNEIKVPMMIEMLLMLTLVYDSVH